MGNVMEGLYAHSGTRQVAAKISIRTKRQEENPCTLENYTLALQEGRYPCDIDRTWIVELSLNAQCAKDGLA